MANPANLEDLEPRTLWQSLKKIQSRGQIYSSDLLAMYRMIRSFPARNVIKCKMLASKTSRPKSVHPLQDF